MNVTLAETIVTMDEIWARHSPLPVTRGDIERMPGSFLIWSGRGGRSQRTWLVSDHPVCGAKVGFAKIFLMPQPPLLTRRGMRLLQTADQFVHGSVRDLCFESALI
jgi:hypothetical protein